LFDEDFNYIHHDTPEHKLGHPDLFECQVSGSDLDRQ